MEMKALTLKQFQGKLLSLYKDLVIFFKSNGVNLFIHSGSLLGWVRDNKFIEWDDDMDSFVNIVEYAKIRFLLVRYCNEKGLVILDSFINKDYEIGKIFNKEKVVVKFDNKYYETHIGINLFFTTSYSKQSKKSISFWSTLAYRTTWPAVLVKRKDWNIAYSYFLYCSNIIAMSLSKITGILFVAREMLNKSAMVIPNINTRYQIVLSRFSKHKAIYDTNKFTTKNEYLNIVSNYEEALETSYGNDWMNVPEDDKHIPESIFTGDTNLDYFIKKNGSVNTNEIKYYFGFGKRNYNRFFKIK